MTFEEKVAKLRAVEGGTLTVTDYFPANGRPYRYASVEVQTDGYASIIGAMATLAVEIGGHLSFFTHYSPPKLDIILSRSLTDEEIGDEPPCTPRPVVV